MIGGGGGRWRGRWRGRWAALAAPLALVAGGVLAAACTDIPTGPEEPFSIEFRGLPFPVVVRGDTLRAADGSPAPLSATVYNVDGQPIAGAPIEFLIPGRGATLLPGGYVRGDSIVGRTGGVLVYARIASLQSLPETVFVAPAGPDSLLRVAPDDLVLTYDVLPQPDTSAALEVRVVRSDPQSADGLAGVEHWPVSYTLVLDGDTLAREDTSLVWLVQGAALTPATADTTDATGRAALRVRVNAFSPDVDGLDSAVVYVSTPRPGPTLPGSPIRFTIRFRARD
ncbi:MAG: hypothetical protein ACYC2G_17130 [Gemmatimonadaceae bacterium]